MKFQSEEKKTNFIKKVQENRGKLPGLDEILRLLKEGWTQTQIAIKFGVSRQSVNKALDKLKI